MHGEPEAESIKHATEEAETHATTGGAAAAGAVTGGVIGLAGGPLGAALGAVGGAIVGAAAERMMHSEDDTLRGADGLESAEPTASRVSEDRLDSTAASVRSPRNPEQ